MSATGEADIGICPVVQGGRAMSTAGDKGTAGEHTEADR
jgi:hypothetical protein